MKTEEIMKRKREVTLTNDEIAILEEAKEANKHWFKSILRGGEIMIPRRRKYSGSSEQDPYTNFIYLALRRRMRVMNTFDVYTDIKMARSDVQTGDFADESALDTEFDGMNYKGLKAGWMQRPWEERRKVIIALMGDLRYDLFTDEELEEILD